MKPSLRNASQTTELLRILRSARIENIEFDTRIPGAVPHQIGFFKNQLVGFGQKLSYFVVWFGRSSSLIFVFKFLVKNGKGTAILI